MQLCYRDCKDDATQLQDKGWRRSPARKLWHVLVEFVNGCSARKVALDSTGADFFDIDYLVRLHGSIMSFTMGSRVVLAIWYWQWHRNLVDKKE